MAQFPFKQDPPVPYSAPTVTQKAALEATWLAETLAGGACVGGDRTVADRREAHIRERAYFKGAQRGFAPGGEVEDWLEAERELADASPHAGGQRTR